MMSMFGYVRVTATFLRDAAVVDLELKAVPPVVAVVRGVDDLVAVAHQSVGHRLECRPLPGSLSVPSSGRAVMMKSKAAGGSGSPSSSASNPIGHRGRPESLHAAGERLGRLGATVVHGRQVGLPEIGIQPIALGEPGQTVGDSHVQVSDHDRAVEDRAQSGTCCRCWHAVLDHRRRRSPPPGPRVAGR